MSAYNGSRLPPNIRQFESQLVQTPLETNDYRAICSATVVFDDGRQFTEIADAIENGSTAAESLIDMAVAKAKDRVLAHASASRGQPATPPQNMPEESMFAQATPSSRSSANGGGSKPISDKQKLCIAGKCRFQNRYPDMLAQEKFGRSLNELQGSQADKLIKFLGG